MHMIIIVIGRLYERNSGGNGNSGGFHRDQSRNPGAVSQAIHGVFQRHVPERKEGKG